ncbi:MAG TPA: FAD-binding protein [Polyangiaceae bacterium]|nr:FAD-binding protein [Polyangiaceae bacterium]
MRLQTFEGALRSDDETRASFASDFGRHRARVPWAVFRPETVGDVVDAVRFANRRGIPVVARGQGHTTGGQATMAGALVVDLRGLSTIAIDRRERKANVGAGALWIDVIRQAQTQGVTPPVLTDYVSLTVGGTLSVGGIGGQSFRYGAQVDNVSALTVVDGTGEILRASRDSNRDVFDAVRGGLGRCGIIVQAELDLVEAPERVAIRHVDCPNLGTFLHDQVVLCERGELGYVLGNIPPRGAGWGYSIETVEFLASGAAPQASFEGLAAGVSQAPTMLPYLDFALRLEAMASAMRQSGSWELAHPWIDVFIGARDAESIIGRTLAEITPHDVGEGYVMTYPIQTAKHGAPLVRMPRESMAPDAQPTKWAFLFDVLGSVPDSAVTAWVDRAGRVARQALEVGGSVYPIGSAPMSRSDWERQLGPELGRIRALREARDPASVFPKHDGEAT